MSYEVQYQTPSSPSRAEFDDYAVADDFVRDHGGSIWRVTREPVRSTQMPVGDLPGWKQVLTEDFTRPVPVGGFVGKRADPRAGELLPGYAGYNVYGPGRTSGNEMRVYPDGWPTTHHTARYAPSRIVSVRDDVPGANGVLNIHAQTGVPLSATTAGPLGAAVWFPLPAFSNSFKIGPGLLIEYRLRTANWNKSNPTNFHVVPLLINPNLGGWPKDGESDHPETDAAPEGPVQGWHHYAVGPGASDRKERIYGPPGAVMGDWHTYGIEWTPQYIAYLVDGIECFRTTVQVPQNPLAFILQVEATTTAPAPEVEGDVQFDWVTIYSKTP